MTKEKDYLGLILVGKYVYFDGWSREVELIERRWQGVVVVVGCSLLHQITYD